jgi:hypothetical protein
MAYYKYDFEGLWFAIYKQVLVHNENLGADALDKSQLREVATSIFIAQTQKGVHKPLLINSFMESVMNKIRFIKDRKKQEAIYNTISKILKEGK